MPRPKKTSAYVIWGSKADPNRDVDKVIKTTPTRISESALSVTIGSRLARRCPMPNIRGDRPQPEEDTE